MVDKATKAELTRQLGQHMLNAYQNGLFGKVSKPEIDIFVFSYAVKILLLDHDRVWNSNGQINWLRLGAGELIRIGTQLKLTKARVQSLVEQAYALDRDSELSPQEVIAELLALIHSSESISGRGQQGVIRLQVLNRATRLALEGFFVASGVIVDGSFNRDLLVLPTSEVLKALLTHADNQDELLKQMVTVAQSHLPADQAAALDAQAQNESSLPFAKRLADLAAHTAVQTTTRWSLTFCLTWLAQHLGA